MLLGGFVAPIDAVVAAGGIQQVPQYFSEGREPWEAPLERRRGPTSPATFSFYIAANLYDSSTDYSAIIEGTPQTQTTDVILLTTFPAPYFMAVAVGTKLLDVLATTGPTSFIAYNLGNGNIFDQPRLPGDVPAIATDSQGTTYASITGSTSGTPGVLVFPYGATSPSYTITNGFLIPGLLAVDGHDNLYVSYGNNIAVYPPGATTPARTISQGINNPGLMTFDKANRLVVYNSGSNAITVYKPKHRAPVSTITDGINGPSAIAVGPTGTLYVANFDGNDITEYDHEGSALSRTITTDTKAPRSIAVDSQDSLYEFVLGYKSGRAFLVYTYPHQSLQPSGKPWIFYQPTHLFEGLLVTTAGPAW